MGCCCFHNGSIDCRLRSKSTLHSAAYRRCCNCWAAACRPRAGPEAAEGAAVPLRVGRGSLCLVGTVTGRAPGARCGGSSSIISLAAALYCGIPVHALQSVFAPSPSPFLSTGISFEDYRVVSILTVYLYINNEVSISNHQRNSKGQLSPSMLLLPLLLLRQPAQMSRPASSPPASRQM